MPRGQGGVLKPSFHKKACHSMELSKGNVSNGDAEGPWIKPEADLYPPFAAGPGEQSVSFKRFPGAREMVQLAAQA